MVARDGKVLVADPVVYGKAYAYERDVFVTGDILRIGVAEDEIGLARS